MCLLTNYTSEPVHFGVIDSQRSVGVTHWLQADALGSTRQLTTGLEAISDEFLYDAWGMLVSRTGNTAMPFLWVGQHGYHHLSTDSQIYVRARFYDYSTGRWISPDPLEPVDGPNRFTYVANLPTRNVDPSGTLTIRSLPPSSYSCNSTNAVQWEFQLDSEIKVRGKVQKGAPCIGFIIQHVTVTCATCFCGGCNRCRLPGRETYSYWEAIPVQHRAPVAQFLDTGFQSTWADSCGFYKQVGQAKFYCRKRADAKRAGGGEAGTGTLPGWTQGLLFGTRCKTTAGRFFATDNRTLVDKFWNEKPVEGPASRMVEYDWDCCFGSNKFELRYEPPIEQSDDNGRVST